jgi:glutathione synthase/RimK-type ligase-like ATP-grasp enzyme
VLWVEQASRVTRVLNPFSVVVWSSDKHYLNDLSAAGVPVVATHFIEPGDEHWNFPTGFAEFVVKPAISAGSRDTMRYSHAARSAANTHVRRLLDAQRSVMIQPYLPSVDTVAETALLFFDGEYSHAIRKGPLLQVDVEGEKVEGLFIQEQIDPREPTPTQLEVARAALAVVPRGPEQLLYARVDLIDDTHGNPVVLELELVEPSVFLVTDPSAATRFAEAIFRSL